MIAPGRSLPKIFVSSAASSGAVDVHSAQVGRGLQRSSLPPQSGCGGSGIVGMGRAGGMRRSMCSSTLKASAIAHSWPTVIFAFPASSSETYGADTPMRCAKAACVIPMARRASRIALPANFEATALVAVRGTCD